MTMKIVKATESLPIMQLVGCIYSAPGLGKTTLSFTADDPLLLDFDHGVHRALYRRDTVQPETWEDVAGMERSDFDPYKSVIVDTAGRAIDMLAQDIMRRDPKLGYAGALSLPGFGRLKAEFASWLKMVKSFGLDVILLVHVEEKESGGETKERIDAQGASKQEIYKSADFMGRILVERATSRDATGKRILTFSPTDTAFGKNPAQLAVITIPAINSESRTLGEVIKQTKYVLNDRIEQQRVVAAMLEVWRTQVMAAAGAEDKAGAFSDLIPLADRLDEKIRENGKRVLWSLAKDNKLTFDAAAKKFVPKPPTPETPAPVPPGDAPAPAEPVKEAGATSAPAAVEKPPAKTRTKAKGKDDGAAVVEPPEKREIGKNGIELRSLFFARYPDDAERSNMFRLLDARVFYGGNVEDARNSPDDLNEIDAGMLLAEIEKGATY